MMIDTIANDNINDTQLTLPNLEVFVGVSRG